METDKRILALLDKPPPKGFARWTGPLLAEELCDIDVQYASCAIRRSNLQGQSLSGASFTAVSQLQEHMDAFISAWNENAEPFVWTKKKVRQRRFKGRREPRQAHAVRHLHEHAV